MKVRNSMLMGGATVAVLLGVGCYRTVTQAQERAEQATKDVPVVGFNFICTMDDLVTERHVGLVAASRTDMFPVAWGLEYAEGNEAVYFQQPGETCQIATE